VQDPEPYLDARGVELQSFFDGDHPAVLDSEHRARVNFELFYFAIEDERKRFVDNPLAHCGRITDPVTYRRFRPDAGSPRIDYNEQPYFFESGVSSAVFAATPDSFLVPKYKMPMLPPDAPVTRER